MKLALEDMKSDYKTEISKNIENYNKEKQQKEQEPQIQKYNSDDSDHEYKDYDSNILKENSPSTIKYQDEKMIQYRDNPTTSIYTLDTAKDYNKNQIWKPKSKKQENFELKNKIKILEMEQINLKEKILKAEKEAKEINRKEKEKTKNLPKQSIISAQQRQDLDEYNQTKLKEIDDYDIYPEVSEPDEFGQFVDQIISNSYKYYVSQPCKTCSKLLSKGSNSHQCRSNHHKIKNLKSK